LERVAIRLPDSFVRPQVDLAWRILQWTDQISQWGDLGEDGWPHRIVWQTCTETLELLGRYVREESLPSEPSATMQRLERAYEATIEEKERQLEQEKEWREEEREKARQQKTEPPS
jgi:hypothetical protein